MTLDIIIVNWNSGELLKDNIISILNSNIHEIDYSIVIIDNDSNDNSLLEISNNEKIKIIKNRENRGFGAACNQGIRETFGKYVLFLNPDTELRENTILDSINFMESNSNLTVLGCKQVNNKGDVLRTCARFITLSNYFNKLSGLSKMFSKIFPDYHMIDWKHNISMEVDHVMGSYYLIRRSKLQELNMFDEDYFVYYEDIDLSYRVKKSGGIVYFNADIEIFHEAGGTSKNIKAKRLFYSLDALLIYGKKHFKKINYLILLFLVMCVEPLIRIVFQILKLNLRGIKETISGYILLYKKRLF